MREPATILEGRTYVVLLSWIRRYRNLTRKTLRKLPIPLLKPVSDLFGYVNPLKFVLTGIAIWSSPSHFFRRIGSVISGKSPFFPDPLQLLTSAATLLILISGFFPRPTSKHMAILYLVVAAVLAPLWALPPSLFFRVLQGMFDQPSPYQSSQFRIYYLRVSHLGFRQIVRTDDIWNRLLSWNTYLALDLNLAPWAYLYFCAFVMMSMIVWLLFLAVALGLTLSAAGFSLGGIFIFFGVPAGILAFGELGQSLFVKPYMQLLEKCTPLPDADATFDFQAINRLVMWKAFSLQPQPLLKVGRPIDEDFVVRLALLWNEYRPQFVSREVTARTKGLQPFARFLLARQEPARLISSGLYKLEMTDYEWGYRASDMYADLTAMSKGKPIDVPLPERTKCTPELMRFMLGKECPADAFEVYLKLWNREP